MRDMSLTQNMQVFKAILRSATTRYHPIFLPSPPHILTITTPYSYHHHSISLPSPPHILTITTPYSYHHHPIFLPSLPHILTITTPYSYHHHPIFLPSPPHILTIITPYSYHHQRKGGRQGNKTITQSTQSKLDILTQQASKTNKP